MNKVLIHNWNSMVKPGDLVFFLGDFCFKNTPGGKQGEGENLTYDHWRKQLNGDIIFIRGNHDKNNTVRALISSCVIKLGGREIHLAHRPEDINPRYQVNLVGHVHEKWKVKWIDNTLLINVGVDVWDFRPVSFEKLHGLIERELKSKLQ